MRIFRIFYFPIDLFFFYLFVYILFKNENIHLNIACLFFIKVNELIAKLSDSTKIKSEDTTNRSVTKGEHFLSLFKKPILDHLLRHQTAMFNKLFDGDSDDRANYEQRIRVFRSFLQHLQCLKQHNVN